MLERRTIEISVPTTGDEEWQALREPLQSGWLTQGPKVAEFEAAFAKRHHVQYALASTSCTTALHLILAALGIGPGDEVIVPAFTWIATANAVLYCGATPVLADVQKATFNLDPANLSKKTTKKTKAIIPVHLFGLCADLDSIRAAAPGLPIIEDAACAAGSAYKGRAAGSIGLAGAFSFHPRKTLTTGEGGMVTTGDRPLTQKIKALRNHGAKVSDQERHQGPDPYLLPEFNVLGYNYRMTDLQAALGLIQLKKLDQFIEEREKMASHYIQELAQIPWLVTPSVPAGYDHSWQSFVCYVDENKAPVSRREIMALLHAKGISSRPGTHAIHLTAYYRERFKFKPDDFPNARDCDRYSLAIPLHNRMIDEDFRYVIAALKSIGGNS